MTNSWTKPDGNGGLLGPHVELTAPQPGRYVVMVEDDPAIADVYVLALGMHGFEVVVASDGDQGLRLITEQARPDVVLLDLSLPRRDGLEVLAQLRVQPHTSRIPVIVLSNRSDDFGKARELGAADCLVKAHTLPVALVKRLESLIGTPAMKG